MHANPQQLPAEEPGLSVRLIDKPRRSTLAPLIFRFFHLLWKSVWRAFQHDAFATAKAAAYSSILTFFPTLLLIGAVLANSRRTEVYLREISDVVGKILPAGAATALAYLRGTTQRAVGVLVTPAWITPW